MGRRRTVVSVLCFLGTTSIVTLARADAAMLTGSVIGAGARPIAGAVVQVDGATDPLCKTTTVADGSYTLACDARGSYSVHASLGELHSQAIEAVELGPDREVALNFLLLPATVDGADPFPGALENSIGFWSRPVANPVLATFASRSVSLRMLSVGTAVVAFLLGALTMVWLGRTFDVETRRLSADEIGSVILNPNRPAAGERVTPVAVAGARGSAATVQYGAEEIAAALATKRYGLVFVALVIAPGLFALFAIALATAMLVGHETYLLLAMALIPAGFLLTSVVIAFQAARIGPPARP